MTRRALLALPLMQIEQCELEAVEKWNKFAQSSERYLKLRMQGVRSLKERERMERQFADVMKSECF